MLHNFWRGCSVVVMADLSRLPGPNADWWDWQLRSACRQADGELFFHPDGERGPARDLRDAAAKAVCATCPVLGQCRSHALQVREPYGVWGGMTEDEREMAYARMGGRMFVVAGMAPA
jgi:WhiB family redox-sensing transcriptional regulator